MAAFLTSTPAGPMAFSSASNLDRSGGDADLAGSGGGDGVLDLVALAAVVDAGACCCRLLSSPDCLLHGLFEQ